MLHSLIKPATGAGMLIALRGALDKGPICTAEDWSSAEAGIRHNMPILL